MIECCANCGREKIDGSVLCQPCLEYIQTLNYCGLADRHSCEPHHSGWRTDAAVVIPLADWEELQHHLDESAKEIPALVELFMRHPA